MVATRSQTYNVSAPINPRALDTCHSLSTVLKVRHEIQQGKPAEDW